MAKFKNNELLIERKNAPVTFWDDLYYYLMRLSWLNLIGFGVLVYLIINLFFGSLYFFSRDGLSPQGLNFFSCFTFSVHTFSTVGYGNISPASSLVQSLTIVETYLGMLSMALMTGLFFSKFSRPSSKFLFSEHLIRTVHNGKTALMFRTANVRSNRVMDAQFSLHVLFDEKTQEGHHFRRFVALPLLRPHSPVFVLSMTAICEVEKNSLAEQLLHRFDQGENIEFLVSVIGLDETFGQTIHATKYYRKSDITKANGFEDMIQMQEGGLRIIDYSKFHQLKM